MVVVTYGHNDPQFGNIGKMYHEYRREIQGHGHPVSMVKPLPGKAVADTFIVWFKREFGYQISWVQNDLGQVIFWDITFPSDEEAVAFKLTHL